MGITELGAVVVVMFCGRSSPILILIGGLYVVGIIGGTDYDASSNSSADTWALNDSVIDGPQFISGYELNFSRLDIIVESVFFSLSRYASNSPNFLDV